MLYICDEKRDSGSLTGVFSAPLCFRKQCPEPYPYVSVVLSEPELLADLAADDVVTLLLYEFADFLTFKTKRKETAVTDFPICKTLLFEDANELRMILLEYDLCGNQE